MIEGLKAFGQAQIILLGLFHIGIDHFGDHFLKGGFRLPAQFLAGLAGITQQLVNFSGTIILRIDGNDDLSGFFFNSLFFSPLAFPSDRYVETLGRNLDELFYGILDAGGNDKILGFILLQRVTKVSPRTGDS